jgi:hypothetical protein
MHEQPQLGIALGKARGVDPHDAADDLIATVPDNLPRPEVRFGQPRICQLPRFAEIRTEC